MPLPDQRAGFVVAPLWRVCEPFRRVAVHEDLASDHPHSKLLGFLEERVDRLRMYGAIDCGRGRAGAQAFPEEHARHRASVFRVSELLFRNEGVLVEPVDELIAVRADDLRLRIVHVAVDEAGEDQRIRAVLLYHRVLRQFGAHLVRRSEVRDPAIRHGDDGVPLVAHRALEAVTKRIARVRQDRSANRGQSIAHRPAFNKWPLPRARVPPHIFPASLRKAQAMCESRHS